MRKLNESIDRFCALHPRLGIPGLMRYIVIANALIYVVSIFDKSGLLLSALAMSPEAVLHGQVWRLATYVLIPTNGGFWLVVSLMFYYWLGDALERLWGSAKFTIYYLSGTLLSALAALLVYAIDRQPIALFGASYVNTALFMAYALTYPDAMVRIYFILPIKMKWLALLDVALILLDGIAIGPIVVLLAVPSFINYFIFTWSFWSMKLGFVRRQADPQVINFKRAKRQAEKKAKETGGYMHKCAVCGITDQDDPNMEFRYCSKCDGYYCYCANHINNHIHIRND